MIPFHIIHPMYSNYGSFTRRWSNTSGGDVANRNFNNKSNLTGPQVGSAGSQLYKISHFKHHLYLNQRIREVIPFQPISPLYSNEVTTHRPGPNDHQGVAVIKNFNNKSNFVLMLFDLSFYKISHFKIHLYFQKTSKCATVIIAINPISQFDTHRVYHSFHALSSHFFTESIDQSSRVPVFQ